MSSHSRRRLSCAWKKTEIRPSSSFSIAPHPRKRRFAHTRKGCAAVQILCVHWSKIVSPQASQTIRRRASFSRPTKTSRQSSVPLVPSVHRTDQRWNGTGVPDGVTFRPFSISFDGCTFWGAGGRALQRAVTSLTGLGPAASPTRTSDSSYLSVPVLAASIPKRY